MTIVLAALALSAVPASAQAPVTIAEALDAPGLTWTSHGNVPVEIVPSPLGPGQYGIGWGAGDAALQASGIETVITGPGLLKFRWKNARGYYLTFSAENIPLGHAHGDESTLGHALFQVPAGRHTLCISNTGYPISSTGCVLDAFTWTPGGIAPVPSAIDDHPGGLPGLFLSRKGDVVLSESPGFADGPGTSLRAGCISTDYQIGILSAAARRVTFSAYASNSCDLDDDEASAGYSVAIAGSHPDPLTYLMIASRPYSRFPFGNWRRDSCVLGDELAALRISFNSDNTDFALYLDHLRLEPVSPGEVLGETSTRSWTAGSKRWKVSAISWGGLLSPLQGSARNELGGPEWLETTVTGAGSASVATHWSGTGQPAVSVELNGVPRTVFTEMTSETGPDAGTVWQRHSASVPAGTHALRWIFSPPDGAGVTTRLLVDDFRFVSRPLPEFAAALDMPAGTAVEAEVAGAWSVTSGDSVTGGTALVCAPGAEPFTSLALAVPGPAVMRFWWKTTSTGLPVSFTAPAVTNSASHRGFALPLVPGTAWQQAEVLLNSAGQARWTVQGTSTADRLLLDAVTFDTSPVSLAQALDDPAGEWTAAAAGVFAMPSQVMAPDQEDAVFLTAQGAWVERTVHGPAALTFDTTDFAGSIAVSLDGQPATLVYIPGFAGQALIVPAIGPHAVRWTVNTASGICLDSVRLISDHAPLPGDAVESSGGGWMLSGAALPLRTSLPELEGGDGIFLSTAAGGASVSRLVSGPGAVEWMEVFGSYESPLEFFVDGVRPLVSSHVRNQQRRATMVANLPPGEHLLTWSLTAANRRAYLDRVTFEARPMKTLREALGLPPGQALTVGGAPLTAGGVVRDLSGPHTDVITPLAVEGADSWIECEVTGPALVSIAAHPVTRPTFPLNSQDYSAFVHPGIYGDGHWLASPGHSLSDGSSGVPIPSAWRIPGGSHRLRWVVRPLKIDYRLSGQILAPALSGLTWSATENQSTAISAAVELPPTPWWSSPDGLAVKAAGPPAFGGSVAGPTFLSNTPAAARGSMSAVFRGPALLTWTGGHPAAPDYFPNGHAVRLEDLVRAPSALAPPQPATTGTWQWRRSQIRLPAGESMVRWNSLADTGLDDVTLTPLPEASLATLIPWAETVSQGGSVPWVATRLPDGQTVLSPSAGLGPGQESRLDLTVHGPVLLRGTTPFFWASDAVLDLKLNGALVQTSSSSTEGASLWQQPVAAGRHLVSLIARRPGETHGVRPALELTVPVATPSGVPVWLPGWEGIALHTNPARPWFFHPPAAGAPAATATLEAPPQPAQLSTWAELEMTGPRWITFYWMKATTPSVSVDGVPLLSSAADVLTRTALSAPGGLFVPRGRHRVRWEGSGSLTLTITSSPDGAALPGDPAIIGMAGHAVFHHNTFTGWETDAAQFVEGTASWRAPRSRSLWLPVRGPAQLAFATRATGGGISTQGLRLWLDAASAGVVPKSSSWTQHTLAIPAGWHTLQFLNTGVSDTLVWLDDVRLTPHDAFGQWCQARALPPLEWNAASDTDGDGLPNAMEFTLGTDPLTFTAQPVTVETLAGGMLAVRYPKSVIPAVAPLSLEVTADLQSWQDAASAGLVLADAGATILAPLPPPFRFARLRVALVP